MPDENYNTGKQPEYSGQGREDKPKYERKVDLIDRELEKSAKELGKLFDEIIADFSS